MFLTFKALHLISMVGWFAGLIGLLYLFRHYVENTQSKEIVSLLQKMSYRLYFFITTPFMILTLIFGSILLLQNFFYMKMGWFHLKLTLLLLLICYHFFIGYVLSRFIKGEIFLSSLQCRLIGHIPTFFLILIIFVAVFKPSF